MILINLLPHREVRRQERQRAFFATSGLAALVGVGAAVFWFGFIQQMTAAQAEKNNFLQSATKVLDGKIQEIANLREEIDALKARQIAVENLQTDRNIPVYLLDELLKQTPEGVYLTALRQNGNVVAIAGVAQTNERVSEMLRNTAYNSQWLERPELVEVKSGGSTPSSGGAAQNRDLRRMFEFSMRVNIKRPTTHESGGSKKQAVSGAANKPGKQ